MLRKDRRERISKRGKKKVICSCTTRFQAYIYGVNIKYMKTGREKREKKEVFGGSDPSGKRGGLLEFPLL